MPFFREVDPGESFAPWDAFREYCGFVPSLYGAQTALPSLIEAECRLAAVLVFGEAALSRKQKERMLLVLAAAGRDAYGITAQYQLLLLLGEREERVEQLLNDYRQAGLPGSEVALLDFAVALGTNGASISREDIAELRSHGCSDEVILDTALVSAWATFVSTLARGLGVAPDFPPPRLPADGGLLRPSGRAARPAGGEEPYVPAPPVGADRFAPFTFLQERFGFIPNFFRAQTLRPDAVEAEVEAVRRILMAEDHLTRIQKERILLVVSAANRNTCFVAVHSAILGTLGVSPEETDRIAVDHRRAGMPEQDAALLDFSLELASERGVFGAEDVARLRRAGFTDPQILEAVAMTALTTFLNTVQFGVGAKPDFAPRRVFEPGSSRIANLSAPQGRPTAGLQEPDPEAGDVASVRHGDYDAFERLLNRNSRRVYRTLLAILGNADEARDAMQETFLKAFQHLGSFEGRSKFSTWLVSIASNTALQMLRERKPLQSIDEPPAEGDESFRPQQIRAWSEDPEEMYSKAELRALVEEHVMSLPAKYRAVVMLRDIEQLSIEEAAAALGLGVPALKSRHLRGRLLLREALTPHFAATARGGKA